MLCAVCTVRRFVSDRRPAEEARLPANPCVEDTISYLCLAKFKTDAEEDPGYWDTRWVLLTDILEADELEWDDVESVLEDFEEKAQAARDSLVGGSGRAT